MSEIKFDGPPPERKRGSIEDQSHQPIAEALKERAGEWAVVRVSKTASAASSAANYIRNAKGSAYGPAGSFEAVSRKVDGEFRVYARFLGTVAGGVR